MKLSQYLAKHKMKPGQFAQKIGVHRSSVVRFCDETRRPDLGTLERIHDATDGQVTAADFFKAARAKRRRASEPMIPEAKAS